MKLLRKVGATSQIFQIFIADSSSTTGAGLSGLTSGSSGFLAYFNRDTDSSPTAITLTSMTAGTFTSSGFVEIDATHMKGWYQFCPPNTALATGASSVAFHLYGAANMAPLPIEVDLDAQVDVTKWLGTAVTAATAGIPDTNVKNINNLVSSGNAAFGPVWDVVRALHTTPGTTGGDIITPPTNFSSMAITAGGIVEADLQTILTTAVSTPATAGILDVNVKNINNVSGASITTVSANQGTTQPVNFTGTAGSALVKSDMVDIAGAAVSATTAQIGTNVVNIKGIPTAGTAGYVGIDWSAMNAPTSTVGLTGTTISTSQVVASVSGAVGSVTGAVGSVTGAVGSVTGNVGGNVVGSVASVTAAVATTSNTKKNTASTGFTFLMTNSTTHLPQTGLTVTATRSIDGGAFGAATNSGTISEVTSGIYSIDLSAADVNGNHIMLLFTAAAADNRYVEIITQP